MNWRNSLTTIFNVQPGEGRPLGLMCGQYFFLGLSYVLTNTVAFALFLKEFGQENLSYAYIAMGVLVAIVAGAYLGLSSIFPLSRLLVLNLIVLVLGTLGFYIGIGWLGATWLIFMLPAWFMTLTNLGNIANWNLTGLIFDVRQGKRLFGLVGAARWLAFSIGGLLTPLLLAFTTTVNLLLIAVCFQLVAIGFQLYTVRAYKHKLELPSEDKKKTKDTATLNSVKTSPLWKDRLALLILAVFFLLIIGYTFSDLIFNDRAAAEFPDTDQLASFLGIFSGGLGIITLLVNLFLVSRVLARFGLWVGLLFAPVGTTALLLTLALAGTFSATQLVLFVISGLALLLFRVGHYSVQTASFQIIFQALPPGQRVVAQTLTEGIIEPLGYLLGGLFILSLTSGLSLGVVGLCFVSLFLELCGCGWQFCWCASIL